MAPAAGLQASVGEVEWPIVPLAGLTSVGPATSGAEKLAYSVSWIALGLALLWLGISRRGGGSGHRALRQAGLAVMLLAVLKVFLLDLGQLAGLDRVLSLLGLGASLLALAALYQRVLGRAD